MRDDIFIPLTTVILLTIALLVFGFVFGYLYANWGVICR